MFAAIPVVKVAQHRHVAGIGSPHGKIDTANAVNSGQVSPQLFINAMVVAFGKQMHIKVCNSSGFKGIRVVDDMLVATADIFQLVVGQITNFQHTFKEVGVVVRFHRKLFVRFGQQHPGRLRLGKIRPNGPTRFTIVLLDHMGAKHLERVVVLVPNNPINLLRVNGYSHIYISQWLKTRPRAHG
jgi:hypothetical protein